MSIDDAKSGLTLRVIWFDDDLIELTCSLAYGKFNGESTCYTTSLQLHNFANALSQFSLTAEGQPMFESGLGDGSKACDLRAYRIDKAGHMAVHVKMATDKLTDRPQSIARLELEMLVETWSLSQFAEQLRQVARTNTGQACLWSVI
ncbi:MAG: hypothetical protein K8R46_00015 [Pirellulales bacterium]|nr:hypothetical protein [Pirellulales bacterium]